MTDQKTIVVDGVALTDVVPKNHPFDSETEDLIFGDELKNGMVVLIMPSERVNEAKSFPDSDNLLMLNRWCQVSKIRVRNVYVYFVGLYPAGEKILRMSYRNTGWVVKNNSIPVETENTVDGDESLTPQS